MKRLVGLPRFETPDLLHPKLPFQNRTRGLLFKDLQTKVFLASDAPVLSPDGAMVVFSTNGGEKLFVRSLDSSSARELPGAAGRDPPAMDFFRKA